MTENPFPASPYCQVRARVASIWADGPDDGTHPDWRPAVGEKVVLTPSIGSQLLTYDVGGADPVIVTVERVDCVVGADGLLTKSDGRPVYIAPTDDPLLSVTGWTWTASIKGKAVVFAAPTGGVVDLAMFIAAPATGNTKEWVERIPELIESLVSIASITSDADDMVVTLTDGESHRIPMPEGAPGHTPVVGLDGDRLTVDGVPVGGSLRGPASTVPGPPGAVATSSTYLIVGPGRPNAPATTGGIITGSEPVGAEYRSTDGAGVGAWGWKKRPTGWEITDGDTGWRVLVNNGVPREGFTPPGAEYLTGGRLRIRRTPTDLWVSYDDLSWSGGELVILGGLAAQWQVAGVTYPGEVYNIGGGNVRLDTTRLIAKASSARLRDGCVYPANVAWPTTLPGTPT